MAAAAGDDCHQDVDAAFTARGSGMPYAALGHLLWFICGGGGTGC